MNYKEIAKMSHEELEAFSVSGSDAAAFMAHYEDMCRTYLHMSVYEFQGILRECPDKESMYMYLEVIPKEKSGAASAIRSLIDDELTKRWEAKEAADYASMKQKNIAVWNALSRPQTKESAKLILDKLLSNAKGYGAEIKEVICRASKELGCGKVTKVIVAATDIATVIKEEPVCFKVVFETGKVLRMEDRWSSYDYGYKFWVDDIQITRSEIITPELRAQRTAEEKRSEEVWNLRNKLYIELVNKAYASLEIKPWSEEDREPISVSEHWVDYTDRYVYGAMAADEEYTEYETRKVEIRNDEQYIEFQASWDDSNEVIIPELEVVRRYSKESECYDITMKVVDDITSGALDRDDIGKFVRGIDFEKLAAEALKQAEAMVDEVITKGETNKVEPVAAKEATPAKTVEVVTEVAPEPSVSEKPKQETEIEEEAENSFHLFAKRQAHVDAMAARMEEKKAEVQEKLATSSPVIFKVTEANAEVIKDSIRKAYKAGRRAVVANLEGDGPNVKAFEEFLGKVAEHMDVKVNHIGAPATPVVTATPNSRMAVLKDRFASASF